jgi:zinc transport system permease protein
MLTDVLTHGFMQRAFLAGIMSASALSIVGVYIVLKRMSNIGEGISNVAFGGLALGILLGVAPLEAALVAALVGVLLINHLRSRLGVFGETAIQILCGGGFALGVIIVSSSSGFNVNLLGFLFGSLLSVTDSDLILIGALTIATFLVAARYSRQLAYIAFDEDSAKVAGLPVERLNLTLMALTALSVVAGMRVVGVLLVSSLLVVPAATAIRLSGNFRRTLLLSVSISVSSVLVGLTSAYYLNIAAGGAVVLTQVLLFFGSGFIKRG